MLQAINKILGGGKEEFALLLKLNELTLHEHKEKERDKL